MQRDCNKNKCKKGELLIKIVCILKNFNDRLFVRISNGKKNGPGFIGGQIQELSFLNYSFVALIIEY